MTSNTLCCFFQIFGPGEKVIYTGERESNGKYTFAAHADGIYKYCFSNKMSSMTPKVVMFSMEVGDAPKDHDQGDGWSIINDFMNSHMHTLTFLDSLYLSFRQNMEGLLKW